MSLQKSSLLSFRFFGRSLLLGCALLLTQCSSDEKLEDVKGDVTVRLPWLPSDLDLTGSDPKIESSGRSAQGRNLSQRTSVRRASQSGVRFENIRLRGIHRLSSVEGDAAQFTMYPQIEGGEATGIIPEAKFFKNDKNVFVPLDFLSGQMASIYAHMERLLLLDRKLGLTAQTGPKNVLITSVNNQSAQMNNAFYKSDLDLFIFIPSDKNLPLAINPGIIAHEYFHSVFQKIFYNPLVAEKILPENMMDLSRSESGSLYSAMNEMDRFYLRVLIQGLNEGLADVWGWIYSGRTDYFALSVPAREAAARDIRAQATLTEASIGFVERCGVRTGLLNVLQGSSSLHQKDGHLRASAYLLGTQYARFFNLYSQTLYNEKGDNQAEVRLDLAKKIVGFLMEFRGELGSAPADLRPVDVIAEFGRKLNMKQSECELFLKVLNAPQNDSAHHYVCRNTGSNNPDSRFRLMQNGDRPAQQNGGDSCM